MGGIAAPRAPIDGSGDEPSSARTRQPVGCRWRRGVGISLKRVYEEPSRADGVRILVERLWPRGLSKERAKVDLWLKEVAPSHELRRWFDHEPAKWDEFRSRYFEELEAHEEAITLIRHHRESGAVTFVFAAREPRFNNAVALKEYLEQP